MTKSKESWWTDTRKILLTQVLTLILTPASVGATIYFTEKYKAPQPRIEYVSVAANTFLESPSDEARNRITAEPFLVAALRGELRNQNVRPECIGWLDGDSWGADCMAPYKSATAQTDAQFGDFLMRLRGDLGKSPLVGMGPTAEQANRARKILAGFRKHLAEVEKRDERRSGEVEIKVGMLNSGPSDGTVFDSARVTFAGGSFNVLADEYVAVKSHSFVQVLFRTAWEDAGSFGGSISSGQEEAVKAWSAMVKKGDQLPFSITVTMSDKSITVDSNVPAH